MRSGTREITAADAAAALSVGERHAEALLKDRLIAGRQLRSGVWLTSRAAVERYQATSQRGRGRALSTATAWGMLWELSGLQATWLSTSTLARVRQQIAALSAEEIVRATSGRTRARYYARSPMSPEVSWEDLIRTGRPAARHLGVRVNRAYNYATGYVRDGSSVAFTSRHLFVEDYESMNVLFDNTLPISYSAPSMPDAVVAVDLTLTGGLYERERGVAIIARLQSAWREARDAV